MIFFPLEKITIFFNFFINQLYLKGKSPKSLTFRAFSMSLTLNKVFINLVVDSVQLAVFGWPDQESFEMLAEGFGSLLMPQFLQQSLHL